MDRDNAEERDLQAAIGRSLEDETSTHTPATQRHPEEDRDIQAAIERSLANSNDSSPSERIPPYNPHFPTAPPRSSEMSDNPSSDSQTVHSGRGDSSTVRRRPVDGVNRTPAKQDTVETKDSLDAVRAARLRRFGTKS